MRSWSPEFNLSKCSEYIAWISWAEPAFSASVIQTDKLGIILPTFLSYSYIYFPSLSHFISSFFFYAAFWFALCNIRWLCALVAAQAKAKHSVFHKRSVPVEQIDTVCQEDKVRNHKLHDYMCLFNRLCYIHPMFCKFIIYTVPLLKSHVWTCQTSI